MADDVRPWPCCAGRASFREKREETRGARRISDVWREKERERERPLVSHSTRSKTRYKTRCSAAPAATKSESRMSIVPAHLAERLRLSTASAWHHRLLSHSLFFFLSLSLFLSRQPRRSVNQVENPQELGTQSPVKPRKGAECDLLSIKTLLRCYTIYV